MLCKTKGCIWSEHNLHIKQPLNKPKLCGSSDTPRSQVKLWPVTETRQCHRPLGRHYLGGEVNNHSLHCYSPKEGKHLVVLL